jgi:hypothetical protein
VNASRQQIIDRLKANTKATGDPMDLQPDWPRIRHKVFYKKTITLPPGRQRAVNAVATHELIERRQKQNKV